ncbi:MAG: hypothetical protein JRF07_09870 [Deltaproteobacteria bacterium]|jgi:hypothetical protein|nr:hypothetical protein [Deltaproteobacteria bacterium]
MQKIILGIVCLMLAACVAVEGTPETITFPNDPNKTYSIVLGMEKEDISRAFGPADKVVLSNSGFEYWEYCYEHKKVVSYMNHPDEHECESLKLFFDGQGKLIDYKK